MLNVLVTRDKMSISKAARHLGMVPSWGVKWQKRYMDKGMNEMQTRSRSGRPPQVSKDTMKEVKKKIKKTIYVTATDVLDFIRNASQTGYMTKYSLQCARKMLWSWGFTRNSRENARQEDKPAKDRPVQKEDQESESSRDVRAT